MSIVKAIKNQLGLSVTPANNFVLDASADNGTMKLARESGQDIMTVDSGGTVGFPIGLSASTVFVNNIQSDGGDLRLMSQGNTDWVVDNSSGALRVFNESVPGLLAMTVAVNGTVSLRLVEYANDSAAATGGVPVGGLYKTSGTVKVRVA